MSRATPAAPSPTVILCSILLLAVGARAGPLNLACETLTGIDFCVECSSNPKQCYLCHKSRAPVWNAAGKITACRATNVKRGTTADSCNRVSGDPNCRRCDGIWCVECMPGFYMNSNYKCVSAGSPPRCSLISGNGNCAACNPDNTCTRCANAAQRVVPLNAIYINAGIMSGSRCMSVAQVNNFARAITWNNAVMPARCIEVDSEFKCNRCQDGYSLTGGVCKLLNQGSKCNRTLRYGQYCARCVANNPNRCAACNGARGLVNGQCALPCRLLFGIGCRNCNASRCITRDPAYANGRR